MSALLAVDIGNTNITVGLFDRNHLVKRMKIPTHGYSAHARLFKALLKRDVDAVAISSVVPLALSRILMCLNSLGARNIVVAGKDLKVPVVNRYRVKSEVGQDRLVNAFAAKVLYGAPAVIVDFGTAITFDVVSPKGEYLGGLILPGIAMGLKSLYEKTALLPRVELKAASSVIGRDTVSSMRGGILFGLGAMCDGLVAQYAKLLGKRLRVIATGGNAGLIRRYAKSIRVVDEDLTLKGLNLLSEL